jgi:hypothetical protein
MDKESATTARTMSTQVNQDEEGMPAEIDFSKGVRGKFCKPGGRLSLPVSLEAEVQDDLAERARARRTEVGQLVNERPGEDIELIEAAKQLPRLGVAALRSKYPQLAAAQLLRGWRAQ